jgi:hypothetical protein
MATSFAIISSACAHWYRSAGQLKKRRRAVRAIPSLFLGTRQDEDRPVRTTVRRTAVDGLLEVDSEVAAPS